MASPSRTTMSLDFAACSATLTNNLCQSGALAMAAAFVHSGEPRRLELAGVSAGAAVAFTDLCIALAEAPAGDRLHSIDVAGMGNVSWKASPLDETGETEILVFALYDIDHGPPS